MVERLQLGLAASGAGHHQVAQQVGGQRGNVAIVRVRRLLQSGGEQGVAPMPVWKLAPRRAAREARAGGPGRVARWAVWRWPMHHRLVRYGHSVHKGRISHLFQPIPLTKILLVGSLAVRAASCHICASKHTTKRVSFKRIAGFEILVRARCSFCAGQAA